MGDPEQPDLDAPSDAPARVRLPGAAQAGHLRRGTPLCHRERRAVRRPISASKDTVLLWPNETIWLAVDFTLPEDAAFRGAQRYMFHCHNLEHEDGMMMRNFAVL